MNSGCLPVLLDDPAFLADVEPARIAFCCPREIGGPRVHVRRPVDDRVRVFAGAIVFEYLRGKQVLGELPVAGVEDVAGLQRGRRGGRGVGSSRKGADPADREDGECGSQ